MRCYLPFPGCTAGFCLRSYLAPHLRLSRKSWAAFSCHFAYRRGEKKKSKRKRKTETKQACKHRARLMRSEFLFLPRNKEVGTLSKQFVMGFLIIPAL